MRKACLIILCFITTACSGISLPNEDIYLSCKSKYGIYKLKIFRNVWEEDQKWKIYSFNDLENRYENSPVLFDNESGSSEIKVTENFIKFNSGGGFKTKGIISRINGEIHLNDSVGVDIGTCEKSSDLSLEKNKKF